MKSNYKKLGEFISPKSYLNEGMEITELLGISNQKYFQKSHTNVNGIDFSTYRIVRAGQFAFNRATTRNGEKISIALRQGNDCIVSPSYRIFQVNNENELLSEYLLMWFRRPEFDRYVRFKSHGSAHEFFEYDQMCEVLLPIPSIEKQREIVAEYNVVQNRIALNNQLIQKLEETAQAIYKQWFVDFEFPDKDGNPYKSSGGEMVESELGEIPEGWKVVELGDLLASKGYIRGPFGSALIKEDMLEDGIPIYEQQHVLMEHRQFRYFINIVKYNSLKRFETKLDDILVSCSGVNLGQITMIKQSDPIGIINQALLILRVNKLRIDSICVNYFLKSEEGSRLLIQESGGSAQPNIAKREIVQAIPFILPVKEVSDKLSQILRIIEIGIDINRKESRKLGALTDLLLSKLATV